MCILSLKNPTSSVKWFIGIQGPCDRSLLYFGNRNQNIILEIYRYNSIFVIHLWSHLYTTLWWYLLSSIFRSLLHTICSLNLRMYQVRVCSCSVYIREIIFFTFSSLWDYQVKLSGFSGFSTRVGLNLYGNFALYFLPRYILQASLDSFFFLIWIELSYREREILESCWIILYSCAVNHFIRYDTKSRSDSRNWYRIFIFIN